MSLQLPTRGAPPSNYDYGTGTLEPTSVRRKVKPVARGSPTTRNHARFMFMNASPNRLEEAEAMTDVREVEDRLRHSQALLSNTTLCDALPGGRAQVASRHDALQARLEYLYSMQGLNKQMREAKLEEDEAIPPVHHVKKEDDMPSPVKKEEDMDDTFSAALARQEAAAYVSPPLSSSPPQNSVQSRWTKAIPEVSFMHGKMAQLSLSESLALQAKESEKFAAQRIAALQRAEVHRNELLRDSERRLAANRHLSAAGYDDGYPEDEQDDYDWHQEGYYDDDNGS